VSERFSKCGLEWCISCTLQYVEEREKNRSDAGDEVSKTSETPPRGKSAEHEVPKTAERPMTGERPT
jgi:hypothetical protein